MSEQNSFTLDTVVVRLPDILFAEVDDDLVILSIVDGKYYGTEVVGRRIWELIEQPTKITDLCAALQDEFDVDSATCERETMNFLTLLLGKKLIELRNAETDRAQ